MPNAVDLETFIYETKTSEQGRFAIEHGLTLQPSIRYHRIYGMTVAIQHKNGNWHSIELSHVVDNRFWWNDRAIEGLIASPNFAQRPVRIIVFAAAVVG